MKKRVLLIVLLASVLLLTGCAAGSVDYENQLGDEEREKYVLKYLEEKYEKNFSIEYLEKEDVEVNCDKEGNCGYVTGAYVYTYECRDENGVVFQVRYTDPYILSENDEVVDAKVVSYYDDVLKFNEENVKLTNEYESIIRKYTTVYKRIYKSGYEHFNYYEDDIDDNFGYVYFIVCADEKAAMNLYNEVNLHRRHLDQGSGSKMTVEFYFMRDWGLYNELNVNSSDVDPGTSEVTTLEKLTGLYEQVIGKDDEFNTRMYSGDTYNIEADHYYRSSFQYVAYYINDGDFQVKGLKSSKEDVKAVVIEDYNYDENIEFLEELEEEE